MNSIQSAPVTSSPVRPGRVITFAAAIVVPVLALAVSPWPTNVTLVYLGMLPPFIGLMVNGTRVALTTSALVPVAMVAGMLLRDYPAAGALFMAAVAAAVGLSSARGWHAVGAFVGSLAGYGLIGAPWVQFTGPPVPAASTAAAMGAAAGIMLGSGLWVTFAGAVSLRGLRLASPKHASRRTARYLAGSLAVLVGTGTLAALRLTPDEHVWWVVLTLFAVVQPGYMATLSRTAVRVGGTIVGIAIAAVLAALNDGQGPLLVVIGLALSAAAVAAYARLPYWVYSTLLTPAVVLMTGHSASSIIHGATQRIAFTLGVGLAATVFLTVGHVILTRHSRAALERPA